MEKTAIIFFLLLWEVVNAKYDLTKKSFQIPSKFRVIDVSHILPIRTEFDCGFNKEITATKLIGL